MAAGNELEEEHDWSVGDDGPSSMAEDCTFVTVLIKHLSPLVDSKAFTEARIAALRAEADALENTLRS